MNEQTKQLLLVTENDVTICKKIIQLSFQKIYDSKTQRGGVKMLRNLLILHVLQKARTAYLNYSKVKT